MRIHFMFEPDSAARFEELGRLAERLGFEAVWTANIISARDPFVAFSRLASNSRRIRLGPVAISPFELHPVKIAGSLHALNELAPGRAQIVIGGGGGSVIAMGLKPRRTSVMPRMVRGVRECLEILRRLSPDETLDFEGEVFQLHGYRPSWVAGPRPRLYVAANGPQMLRLGTALGDGLMLSDISEAWIGDTMARIRAGLADAGRDVAGFPVNNVLAWHVKADRAAAYVEARRKLWVRGVWERARLEPFLTPAECDLVQAALPAWARAYASDSPEVPGVPQAIVDRIADAMTLTGDLASVDAHVARLRALEAAGVNEVSLRVYGDPADSIRLVAERVAPALA